VFNCLQWSNIYFTSVKFIKQLNIYLYLCLFSDAPNSLEIFGFIDGGEYRAIENSQGQLSCTITGGNPTPTLSWDCFNSGTYISTNEGIVTKNQTWDVERGKDKTCFCRSFHYSGNRSVSVYIKILCKFHHFFKLINYCLILN
jgi:hypothetical protein